MAEAEDVLVDVAHHATVYAQDLWRRHRPSRANTSSLRLTDVAQRISLLLSAVFGHAPPLRAAQTPPPPTLLQTLFRRHEQPLSRQALPATDGDTIWLPTELPVRSTHAALERYRILALQQAMRATRGSAQSLPSTATLLERDLYLLLEAIAADAALAHLLPGLVQGLNALRRDALAQRPAPERFAAGRQGLEALLCGVLRTDCRTAPPDLSIAPSPAEAWRQAQSLAASMLLESDPALQRIRHPLCKDLWTGEFKCPPSPSQSIHAQSADSAEKSDKPPRSARLARRPEVREAAEDDRRTGPWMVQTAQPQEHAEDPIGMQRPTDRDESTAAEEFADSLSELPEARLVAAPGKPKEVLLSDDPLPSRTKTAAAITPGNAATFTYPEWDYRIGAYREPGARVHLLPASQGSPQWVAATLAEHRAMLDAIRRRFEMLRADRVRLRKQIDGADIDLDAYIDSRADFHAGRPMAQGLYQTWRAARRDMAIALLIDVSGSTDAWVSANRRVIDVEREALLLVCIALEGMNESFAVHAFSGEGPGMVTLRAIKDFGEHHSDEVAQRIAALEPEHYTRAGAAIRHVTASLMRQSARHRLLLLLSDGKPNDIDDYEGRYGVEDMRQAVTEAKLQGIFPFCLTIDRQAAHYLPQVFGAHQYALLPRPELLPTVLLDWLKRLVEQ